MLSGVSAGLVATTLGSPMDVVSTRIMVNKQKGYTTGMVGTCQQMLLKEGPTSFYQGVNIHLQPTPHAACVAYGKMRNTTYPQHMTCLSACG